MKNMQQILKTLFKLLGIGGAATAAGITLFLSLPIASPDYSKRGGEGPSIIDSEVIGSIVGNGNTFEVHVDQSIHYQGGNVINLTSYKAGDVINLNYTAQQVDTIDSAEIESIVGKFSDF